MITDYEHLPIGKYIKILELSQTEDNDVAIISVLADKTEDELMHLPIVDYRTLADKAGFLFYQPSPAKIRGEYTCGQFKLRLDKKAEKLTTAQYIDFKEFAKAGVTDICEYLSVILIPQGKTYNEGYDREDVRDAIRGTLPTPDALGIRDFFVMRLGRLIAASLTYSRMIAASLKDKETRTKIRRQIAELEASLTSGVGLEMWTMLQTSPAGVGTRYIR